MGSSAVTGIKFTSTVSLTWYVNNAILGDPLFHPSIHPNLLPGWVCWFSYYVSSHFLLSYVPNYYSHWRSVRKNESEKAACTYVANFGGGHSD